MIEAIEEVESFIEFCQGQVVGSNEQEYEIYLACADNGEGLDITTGGVLLTFDEWMNK